MEGIDRETLRAELGSLELRLVDRLSDALISKADAKVVEQHDARINALELSRAARENMPTDIAEIDKRVDRLERLRWAIPSTGVLMVILTGILTAYYLTH